MYKSDLKTIQQNNYEREPTWSTASFYDQQLSKRPENVKFAHIQELQEAQEKDFYQKIQYLSNQLILKEEQFRKRIRQSQNQNSSSAKLISQVEFENNNILKKIHKEDRTKQWASEMENTIKQIMSDKMEIEQKNYEKAHRQLQTFSEKLKEQEQNLRQQKKQRQHFWEGIIDELGEQIMNLEGMIDNQKVESQEKIIEMQSQIIQMQEETSIKLMNETKRREQQHAFLTRLIENVMNKLIL